MEAETDLLRKRSSCTGNDGRQKRVYTLTSRVTNATDKPLWTVAYYFPPKLLFPMLFMCSDYSRNSDSAQQIFIENLVSFRYFLVPGSTQIEQDEGIVLVLKTLSPSGEGRCTASGESSGHMRISKGTAKPKMSL